MNKSEEAERRVKAVANLAQQCREHRVLQSFGWIIDDEHDEASVRIAMVRSLSAWNDNVVANHMVIQALSSPAVRVAAIQTLDQIGPAKGAKETRLLSELAALRQDDAQFRFVKGLPLHFGRDARLLSFLKDTMRSPNRFQRAVAASILLGLGEVEPALAAATDPDPRVRTSIASTIGWFHEARGSDALQRLIHDPDPLVAWKARTSFALLVGGTVEQKPFPFTWRPLLSDLAELRSSKPRSGASDAQIQSAERRIGRKLPPSYRSFLQESNGFQNLSFIPLLHAAEDIDWFRVRNSEWAEAYHQTYPNLGSCLQISAAGDAAVILLNPEVTASDGEWQVYFFANWIPGARTYASFRAYMEHEVVDGSEWRNR
jgi:hypothetical protein